MHRRSKTQYYTHIFYFMSVLVHDRRACHEFMMRNVLDHDRTAVQVYRRIPWSIFVIRFATRNIAKNQEHHATTAANTYASANPQTTPQPSPSLHPMHAIHLDPTLSYFLTVSTPTLHIWNTHQYRVLLGRFVVPASVTGEEDPLEDALSSSNSRVIIASSPEASYCTFRCITILINSCM